MVMILLVTVLSSGFSARAVELDGLLQEKMWTELKPFTVIQNRDLPNCSVDVAKVFVCFDEKNYITYLGFRFTHKKYTNEEALTLTGVSVRVEDTDFLVFSSQSTDEINGDAYKIQGAVYPLSDTSTTAEVMIAQKYGLGAPLHVQLRFYDADGIPSNVYPLEIPAPVAATAPLEEPNGILTATQPATTKAPKTTKPTTSRTRKVTDPTTQKTTVEKTTVEKTTKEKTTKAKTTKVKTTKAPKTTKVKTTKAKTTKTKTSKSYQGLTGNEQLLQEVLAEQEKTRNILYIGIGALIVAVFVFCSCLLKRRDDK